MPESSETNTPGYLNCGHELSEWRVRTDGWEYCQGCRREYQRQYRKRPGKREKAREYYRKYMEDPGKLARMRAGNRESQRKYYRRRQEDGAYYAYEHGVSVEDAKRALEVKPTKCEICNRECSLVFDHCADRRKFRGWLCVKCNAGLGQFAHDVDTLRAAAAYISDRRYSPSCMATCRAGQK